MTLKDVLNKLPGSWHELTFQAYLRTLDVPVQPVADESKANYWKFVMLVSALVDIDAYEFNLLLKKIDDKVIKERNKDLATLEQIKVKLAFLDHPLDKIDKPKLKWKTMEEITFGDYIFFQQHAKDEATAIKNWSKLTRQFCYIEEKKWFRKAKRIQLTEEDVNNLSMPEVYTGFFTQMKRLDKSLLRIAKSSAWVLLKQLLKLKAKTITRSLRKKLRLRKTSNNTTSGAGT